MRKIVIILLILMMEATCFGIDLESDCILYCPMDDTAASTDIEEKIGVSTCTSVNPASSMTTGGKLNTALDFNGVDDHIDVVYSNGLWTKDANNPLDFTGRFGYVWLEDGTYHFYYTNSDYDVNHATSTDGLNWTQDDSNNPVLAQGTGSEWDAGGTSGARVFKYDDTWYLLYRGRSNDGNYAMGIASASDGVNFTKEPTNPILSGTEGEWDGEPGCNFDAFSIIRVGTTWYLWYNADEQIEGWGYRAMGLATSTTGFARECWTKDPRNPILPSGRYCADIFKYEDYYYLLVPATPTTGYGDNGYFELYRSPNPTFYVEEREYLGKPLEVGSDGEFDDYYVDTPCVLTLDVNKNTYEGDEVKVYYTGKEEGEDWSHGLCTFNLSDLVNYRPGIDSNSDGLTMVFWAKWDTQQTQTLMNKGKGSAGYAYSGLPYVHDYAGSTVRVAVGDGSGSSAYTLHTVGDTPDVGVWTFYAVGFDSVTRQIFSSVDGGALSYDDYTFSGNPVFHNYPLIIGNRYGYGSPFDGQIDNVMIFNEALSIEKIRFLYRNGRGNKLLKSPDRLGIGNYLGRKLIR